MKMLTIRKVFFVTFNFFSELGGAHNTWSVRFVKKVFSVTFGCFSRIRLGFIFVRNGTDDTIGTIKKPSLKNPLKTDFGFGFGFGGFGFRSVFDVDRFLYFCIKNKEFAFPLFRFSAQNNGLVHQNKRSVFSNLDQTVILAEEKRMIRNFFFSGMDWKSEKSS